MSPSRTTPSWPPRETHGPQSSQRRPTTLILVAYISPLPSLFFYYLANLFIRPERKGFQSARITTITGLMNVL